METLLAAVVVEHWVALVAHLVVYYAAVTHVVLDLLHILATTHHGGAVYLGQLESGFARVAYETYVVVHFLASQV